MSGRLNYDGVFDDLVSLDTRAGASQLLGIRRRVPVLRRWSAGMGAPVDDDLDGENLFLVSRSGRVAHVLSDVATASAPPARR